ncbi:MAG: IPT/TIG domain-containing protein [Candidatus Shapirobacteria bacterium]|nr:IPT/TIG domain-containing protein [Candidatus Shapirobacteria bacterium]
MNLKKTIIFPLVVIAQTIIFYLLVIIPAEYFLTEKYLILKYIYPQQKTRVFLTIFLIIFLLNYFFFKIKKMGEKFWPVLAAALTVALFVNRAYTGFYHRLQENPKIYSLSSDWSIVGMEVEIDGKNFGSTWQAGKVAVDNFEFQIKDWTEEKIVVAQPHPPQFFSGELCVEKGNGRVSNCLPFTIKSPGELHQE